MQVLDFIQLHLHFDCVWAKPCKKEYKTRVRNQILKVKQHKSDVTWRMKKASHVTAERWVLAITDGTMVCTGCGPIPVTVGKRLSWPLLTIIIYCNYPANNGIIYPKVTTVTFPLTLQVGTKTRSVRYLSLFLHISSWFCWEGQTLMVEGQTSLHLHIC